MKKSKFLCITLIALLLTACGNVDPVTFTAESSTNTTSVTGGGTGTGGGGTGTGSASLQITSGATHDVLEGSAIGTKVFIASANNISGRVYTYSLTPAEYFAIDTVGNVLVAKVSDYEKAVEHKATLSISNGQSSVSQQLTFRVVNENDTVPTISSASSISVSQTAQVGDVVLTILADGGDGSKDGTLTYFLSQSTAFSLNGNKIVVANSNFSQTSNHNLTLAVSDGKYQTSQLITITVSSSKSMQLKQPLLDKNFTIRQGVKYVGQWVLPTGYSTNFYPKITSSLPMDASFQVTNQSIQEFSMLYKGGLSSFSLDYVLVDGSGQQSKDSAKFTFTVEQYDPLRKHQWYLQNTGQKAFASLSGTAGEDIRVSPVHEQNILGSGVKVAIVDEGLEITHEDLKDNVVVGKSYDFIDNDTNPQPRGTTGDHGTSVAGITAMRGWNNKGGVGVAPESSIVGYNYLAPSLKEGKFLFTSMGYAHLVQINTPSRENQVFNLSLGEAPQTIYSVYGARDGSSLWVDTARCGTTGNSFRFGSTEGFINKSNCVPLNAGKGAVYVKSAGNYYSDSACKNQPSELSCDVVNGAEISEGNPHMLVISSLNARGKRASYASVGPAVWVSAPGGEAGYSNSVYDTINSRFGLNYVWSSDVVKRPSMVTTDESGCNKGYSTERHKLTHNGTSYFLPYTPFHGTLVFASNGSTSIVPNAENSNCNYVSDFIGSSAAAPVVSGVAALLLSVNKDLTWRDVRYILAKTARQTDKQVSAYSKQVSDGSQLLRATWQTNQANFPFHHWYGFGVVNAEAAVTMAKSYTHFLTNDKLIQGEWIDGTFPSNNAIADNSVKGVEGTVNVPAQNMQWIEGVQIRLSVTHPYISDISAKLISPSGTESIVVRAFNSFGDNDNYKDTLFYTNKFYRETAIDGQWKLVITDSRSGNVGTATDWKIRFYGEKK